MAGLKGLWRRDHARFRSFKSGSARAYLGNDRSQVLRIPSSALRQSEPITVGEHAVADAWPENAIGNSRGLWPASYIRVRTRWRWRDIR